MSFDNKGSGESGWQPIETAPVVDLEREEIPRCLVFSKQTGVQIGRAWKYASGESRADAAGFHGEWEFTHWMTLPEPPNVT